MTKTLIYKRKATAPLRLNTGKTLILKKKVETPKRKYYKKPYA